MAERPTKPKPAPLNFPQGSPSSTGETDVAMESGDAAKPRVRAIPPPTSNNALQQLDESEASKRGWDPRVDGRFRFSLEHHYVDEGGSSAFAGVVPHDAVDGAAKDAEAERHHQHNQNTIDGKIALNVCRDDEPRVELTLQASLVNAINSAYTASGYPSVVTAGNARGAVYGSFVDLRNPSLRAINFPPKESVIVASGQGQMETLLKIVWKRGIHLVAAPEKTTSGATTSAAAAGASAASAQPAAVSASSAATGGAAGAGGGPNAAAPKAASLAQHIQQFPEGVHGIHSSANLRDLILYGQLPAPTEEHAATVAERLRGGNSSPTAQPSTSPSANIPPPPLSPVGTAPVQHTLVSASTFNHLSVYYVCHQDGRFLYSAPVQTLSASIVTRKITAQALFMACQEEADPAHDDRQGSDYAYLGGSSTGVSAGGSSSAPARTPLKFVDVKVSRGGERDVFFPSQSRGSSSSGGSALSFAHADPERKTIQCAVLGFVVEPYLAFGNQNGDIFVFSILEERIVQHLNFNAGTPNCNTTSITTGSASGKLICSPVSVIVEVECGLEKKLGSMVEYAAAAKRNGKSSFMVSESATRRDNKSYYPLSPSIFAAGFDCGDVVLFCVTTGGAWMLKHLPNQYFGSRPIKDITPRIPSFFMRLWTSYAPPATSGEKKPLGSSRTGGGISSSSSSASATPRTMLITAEEVLFVHDEEQHVAAVACNSGTIAIVRLPAMEVVYSISVFDYHAYGDILTLQWTASTPFQLLAPDLLIATGEDDAVTAFQLQPSALTGNTTSSRRGFDTRSSRSSTDSGVLRILEKKRFHKSWVSNTSVLPLAVPLRAVPETGGMPQYQGTCLVGASYDGRTSFWPLLFDGNDMDDDDGRPYLLVEGPTAAIGLHSELVVCTGVGGGGASFFFMSACCRGKVKFWSVNVCPQ